MVEETKMKREFDWTQEFQETMDGTKVRILCRDVKDKYSIVGICQIDDGTETVMSWFANGCFFEDGRPSDYDLRPLPPKKHVRWVNFDADGTSCVFASKEDADDNAYYDRIACIRVEYNDGQFDE